MFSVRKNVFETNSSSTHSICVSKENVENIPKTLHYKYGEYTVSMVNYVFTLARYLDKEEALIDILRQIGVEVICDGSSSEDSYVDHGYEANDFINAILEDFDLLKRCLFNSDSVVYTGNDNGGDYCDLCYSAYDTVFDDDYKRIPNPNHNEAKFDYFFKGN